MQKNKSSSLFLHGGPGANSAAERQILVPLFKAHDRDIHFWKEPILDELKHPKGAFHAYCASISHEIRNRVLVDGPITLIAHSYSSLSLGKVLSDVGKHVKSLIILAPAFDIHNVFKNIMKLAQKDLSSQPLMDKINATTWFWDQPMQEGFHLAATDPDLFGHYWANKKVMAEYFGIWAHNKLALNLDNFFAITSDLSRQIANGTFVAHAPVSIPTIAVFGLMDPIVDRKSESSILRKSFLQLEEITFDSCGHYPHIEDSSQFLKILNSRC